MATIEVAIIQITKINNACILEKKLIVIQYTACNQHDRGSEINGHNSTITVTKYILYSILFFYIIYINQSNPVMSSVISE